MIASSSEEANAADAPVAKNPADVFFGFSRHVELVVSDFWAMSANVRKGGVRRGDRMIHVS